MFVSKKEWQALQRRVTLMERHQSATTLQFGKVTLQELAQALPPYIKELIKKEFAGSCIRQRAKELRGIEVTIGHQDNPCHSLSTFCHGQQGNTNGR